MPEVSIRPSTGTSSASKVSKKPTPAQIARLSQQNSVIQATAEEINEKAKSLLAENPFVDEDYTDYEDSDRDLPEDENLTPINVDTDVPPEPPKTQESDELTLGDIRKLEDRSPSEGNTEGSLDIVQSSDQDMYSQLQKQAFELSSTSPKQSYALNHQEFSILAVLINNIDELGYLSKPLDPATVRDEAFIDHIQNVDFDYVIERIETINKYITFEIKWHELPHDLQRVFTAMQKLKPAGIGSRSHQEYLITIAKCSDHLPEWGIDIFKNHYGNMMERNYAPIAIALNKTKDEIIKALHSLILSYPYPSAHFASSSTYIRPDVKLTFNENGELEADFISCNSIRLTKFRCDNLSGVLQQGNDLTDLAINDFGSSKNQRLNEIEKGIEQFSKTSPEWAEKAREAFNFMKDLGKRQTLLLKIATYIGKEQKDFLESGNDIFIKPLSQKECAEKIGASEAEVSYALNSKKIQIETKAGTLKRDLHIFFNNLDRVDEAICKVIDSEDMHKPLSDDNIAKILNEEYGLKCDRNKVVRARKRLNIASSTERKAKYSTQN